ncbi:hypothetical protein C8F04DRAFT_1396418 [Mycena alexandri]|uniref:Uncharacterized protein n=1 Tax=Mycena alexandri TaxID=1745969 RepID=A0AAD6SSC8_9AGAR|nr:hypothetical protein C8F04DRAFT_1396418 [Mycena alexandri]
MAVPTDPLVKTSNRSRKRAGNPSYNVANVPPEIWAIIARLASRESLARLCSVSLHFCFAFSPLLYANTVNPPLTATQSARLIETVSDEKMYSWKPHPVSLIRSLGLIDGDGTDKFKDKAKATRALKNLGFSSPHTKCCVLSVLHWSLEAGVDELGSILGPPGNFPYLKELIVSSHGTNNNFGFLHIRGLHVLGLDISLASLISAFYTTYDYTICDKPCFKLAEAIQMLPTSSPLLNSLKFKLRIPFDEEAFPHSAYSDLTTAINSIHLPLLTALDLSINLIPDDFEDYPLDLLPRADLSTFLGSHPNITNLKLSVHGTTLKDDLVPRLRSFHGSFRDSIDIFSPQRQLRKLDISLIHEDRYEFHPSPSFILPPETHLLLTTLRIDSVDTFGTTMKMTNELSPNSFHQVVHSFPNLTHLDVRINKRMAKYCHALMSLTKLEYLRLQQYRTRRLGPPSWPATLIFPPTEYSQQFDLLLPFLPRLADIEISVSADIYPVSGEVWDPDSGSESNSESEWHSELDFKQVWSPPEMKLD